MQRYYNFQTTQCFKDEACLTEQKLDFPQQLISPQCKHIPN